MADMSDIPIYSADADRDAFDLCNACGGLCCCLYLAQDENGAYIGQGWLPDYITLWEERLVASGALLTSLSTQASAMRCRWPSRRP